MENLIGIIGSSGAIGKVAANILTTNHKVKGGQRNNKNIINNDNFTYEYLDIFDNESLENFCKTCTVVLNCAGPTYKIRDSIANVCNKFNVKYVDVNGEILLNEEVLNKLSLNSNCYIIGSGAVPGLSSILPSYYCNKDFDTISSIKCYQGGREKATRNSIIDIMASSFESSGYPNSYYDNGDIKKDDNIDIEFKYPVIGFQENIFLKPYLSKEIISVAKKCHIDTAFWYNAIPDEEILNVANNMYTNALKSGLGKMSESQIDENFRIFQAVYTSRPIWNSIVYEIYGTKEGKNYSERIICNLNESYKVCGIVAAMTVEALLNKDVTGLHWSYEIVNAEEVINKLINSNAISDLSVSEIIIDEESGEELEEESFI